MNFLTPLYLLGALAIVAPIVFHLIRQTPRGEVPFSSIMFLQPSPPRVTQRSRIDHWLLLLLRAGALALLALAFARPFWRAMAQVDVSGDRQRVVVLVDTSASMRRGDLWRQAQQRAEAAIAATRPGDDLAIMTFDTSPRTALAFEDGAGLDSDARLAVARGRLNELQPTWRGTALGAALAEAVAAVAGGLDRDTRASRVRRRVILVSDLQSGSQLDALGQFAWPTDVEVDLQIVAVADGNAGIEPLGEASAATGSALEAPSGSAEPKGAEAARVRVVNDGATRVEAFSVGWVNAQGQSVAPAVPAYVPSGESRIVRVPLPPIDAKGATPPPTALRLTGDAFPFDDTAFVASTPSVEEVVRFVGPNRPDDPNGLRYYLDRVFGGTPRRSVRVVDDSTPIDPKTPPALIVVAADPAAEPARTIRRAVEQGSTALAVVQQAEATPGLATLLGVPALDWTESPPNHDALLEQIRFDHPTFAPLAAPQFNDFTKIRFWRHRMVANPDQALTDAQILARFDDGTPAWVEKRVGSGRVVVLTSGWDPGDSQLARSSKFVPLMATLLDRPGAPTGEPKRYRVGDRVTLIDLGLDPKAGPVEFRGPDGSAVTLPVGTAEFAATDAPGVYSAQVAGQGGASRSSAPPARAFAVNLDPNESRTSPLSREDLQQRGVLLASNEARRTLDADALRQMRTAELEGRQKLWRWLVLGALAFLFAETLLAARIDRTRSAPTQPA